MDMKKVRSLDTIAVLRELAQSMRDSVPEANAMASVVGDGAGPLSKQLGETLQGEAVKYETIASDLEAIADEAAHYRAYATARFLVGPAALLGVGDTAASINAIREAPALIEYTASLAVPHGCAATVRLVPFYDEALGEERWAVHYFNSDGGEGITDNASQEDAEQRYWEIAGPLGQTRE